MSKNTNARAIIKELALQAKQRLKNSNYGTKEENKETQRIMIKKNNFKFISNLECNKSEITIKIINDNIENENFNKRVYALLEENADMINPINKLIDNKIYQNFSDFEQEKYILELADKYTKARENYFQHYGC